MKIAFVITRSDAIGGATIHVRDLCRALLDKGDSAFVLVGGTGTGPVTSEFARGNVPFRTIRYLGRPIHPIRDCLAVIELVFVLWREQPDLVSTHTAKAGLLGRIASAVLGTPAIFTPHGWSISDRISARHAKLFQYFERFASRFTARIVNVCVYERELAVRFRIAPPEKMVCIHNGMPDVPYELRRLRVAESPTIICVARMEPPKDHATLIQALHSLKDLNWTLELVGGGPLEPQIRAQVSRLGMCDRVQFCGDSRDVAERLARSHVFALASRSEAFPRSILEGMRAGLPIVSSDVGGVSEAVKNGETGFTVAQNDPASFAACLRRLLTDERLRMEMGERGRARYEALFTFERMSSETFAVYERILAERRQQLRSNIPLLSKKV
jgi:glycosyltransferase involved in cell wall biosynthesis